MIETNGLEKELNQDQTGEIAKEFQEQEANLNQSEAQMDLYSDYAEKYAEYERISAKKKELDAYIKNLKTLIIEEMKAEGVKTKKMTNGTSYTIRVSRFYRADDKSQLVEWCLGTGRQDKLSVHHGTLQSVMKELDVDPDLPPELQGESDVPDFIKHVEEENLTVKGVRSKK